MNVSNFSMFKKRQKAIVTALRGKVELENGHDRSVTVSLPINSPALESGVAKSRGKPSMSAEDLESPWLFRIRAKLRFNNRRGRRRFAGNLIQSTLVCPTFCCLG